MLKKSSSKSQDRTPDSADYTPNFKCPKHPKTFIHSLCLHKDCLTPYICHYCQRTHPKDHAKDLQAIKEVCNNSEEARQYSQHLDSKFSKDEIKTTEESVIAVLQRVEDEFRSRVAEMKLEVKAMFAEVDAEVARRKDIVAFFETLKNLNVPNPDENHLKDMVSQYKLLTECMKQPFNVNLDSIASTFQREVTAVKNKIESDLSLKLKDMASYKAVDFFRLEVKKKLLIPKSQGVAFDSLVYIEKWNVLGFGAGGDSNFVGLYDLSTESLLSAVYDVHIQHIVNTVWVDHKNYLITGSNDYTIRVFRASNGGRTLQPVHRFIGHQSHVRSLRYIQSEDLLVSAGYDPDIKLWNINNFRRQGTISTNSADRMDGSIAYIEVDHLVGIAFNSGDIRFYNIRRKDLVFELKINHSTLR